MADLVIEFHIGLLISGWGGGDVGPVCEVDVGPLCEVDVGLTSPLKYGVDDSPTPSLRLSSMNGPIPSGFVKTSAS